MTALSRIQRCLYVFIQVELFKRSAIQFSSNFSISKFIDIFKNKNQQSQNCVWKGKPWVCTSEVVQLDDSHGIWKPQEALILEQCTYLTEPELWILEEQFYFPWTTTQWARYYLALSPLLLLKKRKCMDSSASKTTCVWPTWFPSMKDDRLYGQDEISEWWYTWMENGSIASGLSHVLAPVL